MVGAVEWVVASLLPVLCVLSNVLYCLLWVVAPSRPPQTAAGASGGCGGGLPCWWVGCCSCLLVVAWVWLFWCAWCGARVCGSVCGLLVLVAVVWGTILSLLGRVRAFSIKLETVCFLYSVLCKVQ